MIIARPKLAGLLTAAAVLAASVIGCGSEPPCGSWGTGDITFAIGEDQSEGRQIERLVEEWERESGKQVELVYLPATADGQRSQLAATAQARSREYDVLGLDVVWTAEFASRGYVEQLDPRFDKAALERDFLPKPLDTARWDDKLWAIPLNTNVGLLFYRPDKGVLAPPKDWQGLEEMASEAPEDMSGFAGQFRPYEGLTTNVLEAIWGEGGDLLADDEAVVNPEGAEDALDRLRRGFGSRGWIDKEALHYDEQETLTAFQDERLLFMRHWPNAYVTLKAGRSRVGEKVGVAPLPGAGALGGQNLAIAACSNDKATALAFIKDLTDVKHQQELFEKGGYPPTRRALYEPERYPSNQDLQELARVVKQALDRAKLRPSRPGYPQATQIIQAIAHEVIRGDPDLTPAEAIAKLEKELEDARLD